MSDWVLNTPLVQLMQQKRFTTKCQYLSDIAKVEIKSLSLPSCFSNQKKHAGLTKNLQFVLRFFVAANQLNTFRFSSENTRRLKPLIVLCCNVKFEQFQDIAIMLSLNILFSIITFLSFSYSQRKAFKWQKRIKYAKFTVFYCH